MFTKKPQTSHLFQRTLTSPSINMLFPSFKKIVFTWRGIILIYIMEK